MTVPAALARSALGHHLASPLFSGLTCPSQNRDDSGGLTTSRVRITCAMRVVLSRVGQLARVS